MKCTIFSVGTELLFGHIINTNTVFLSQQLNSLGFDVYYHYTVGDNQDRLAEALSYMKEKTDLIIISGGLGPTEDDLTKETICQVYNQKLVENTEALNGIKKYFDRLGYEMLPNNRKQSLVPEESMIFHNTCGTAPGFAINSQGMIIIALPGPPREMKRMFLESVKPYLEGFSKEKYYQRIVRLFGIGEAKLETCLLSLIHGQTDPTLATYAKDGECLLKITSKSKNQNEAKVRVEETLKQVEKLVGEYIYSTMDEELPQVVGKKLISKNISISSCESCTGGLFAEKLTDTPGISMVFEKSYITYSNKAKMDILGVKGETLNKYTEISKETAEEMAEGLYRITGSDICISVTGLAGPGGGTKDIPVGTVYIGLFYKGKVISRKLILNDNGREWIRNYSMLSMFDMVNKVIR